MAKRVTGQRPKHVANRTCIACREVAGKRALIRLVRTTHGVEVDTTGKKPGRGAYLHPVATCWRTALESGRIEQALRVRLGKADRLALEDFMAKLPDVVSTDDKSVDKPVDVSHT